MMVLDVTCHEFTAFRAPVTIAAVASIVIFLLPQVVR